MNRESQKILEFLNFKISFCDVTLPRNVEMAILEENQKKNRTTIVIVETSEKEITTDDRVLSETAPISIHFQIMRS